MPPPVSQVDVKVQNDPDRLFRLIHEIISAQENWEKDLAPRILLGLWHPKFIEPARKHLPYVKRAHIGKSPDATEAFSFFFFPFCQVEVSPPIMCLFTLHRHGTGIREEMVLGELRDFLYELLWARDCGRGGLPSGVQGGRKDDSRLDGQCEGGNDAGKSIACTILRIGMLIIPMVLVRPLGSPGHFD